MNKITCLITGASSGIGKEIARGLAKRGADVILVCRNAEKGKATLKEIEEESGAHKVDLLLADLSSQNEIKTLAKTVYEQFPALNVLINNAGIVSREKKFSVDGVELTLATNHLGPFLLTRLLLDLLKKNKPSRIINVSSAIHKWGKIDLNDLSFNKRRYQFLKAYAQSKLLMNTTTFELAKRLKGTGVTVNCFHPGAVKTNLGSDSANNFILKMMDKLIKSFFITPEKAADTAIYLATSPAVENITGAYFAKCKKVSSRNVPENLVDRIWNLSEHLIGLQKQSDKDV